MATLVSPGVSVSVTDESIGAGRGPGTVPFVLIASAQNKSTPNGESVAEGTLASNAGKVYLMTSQRELLQTFGEPKFQSVGSSAIHGSPLNEYGILAAHSYLGLANRAYVVRADIDLAQLEATTVEPKVPAPVGTVWLNTNESEFGINVLVADPNDDTKHVWQSVDVSIVFLELADNNEGANGDYAVEIIGSTIRYLRKDADSWTDLFSIAAANKIVTSAVWPVADAAAASFVNGDRNAAFWINTSKTASAINIIMSKKAASGDYASIPSPAAADDTAANTAYSEAPIAGDHYVQLNFGDTSSYLSIMQYDGTVWATTEDFQASLSTPQVGAVNGTYWYNADVGKDADGIFTADVLINNGTGSWENLTIVDGATRNGDIASAAFFAQSTMPSAADGDVWLDTADLDNYPMLYKFKTNKWVSIDKTDQTSPDGIIFADARPEPGYKVGGSAAGINNGTGTAPDLDLSAPDPDAYPLGMLLWNTSYSTQTVREYKTDVHVYNDNNDLPVYEDRWVLASGTKTNGELFTGIDAQRAVVAKAFNEVLISNNEIRSEAIQYNLIAAPGFPECIDEMVTLNVDRKETAFILGDSPFTLKPDATSLSEWATNALGAPSNGQEGLITASPYLGVYYPSGFSTNTDGEEVVVPASHMMLRTMGYNDQVAYPWFAPAGLQRGKVSNAASVGFVDDEGEYVAVTLNEGQRDTLYANNINPIAFFTGQGIVAFGQKTRSPVVSALDRVNVARLVNYIRTQAEVIARPFLFEPNDKTTRNNVTNTFNGFMSELVTLRGVYDFVVVCDESNNTASRIDRNELWIDLAISPAKSVEFIYIPIRIKNTTES